MADEAGEVSSPKSTVENIRKRKEEDEKKVEELIPQVSLMTPEEIARTIVARERNAERVKKWAGIDTLTGLLRRKPFAREVKKEIEVVRRDPNQRGLIITLADIDNFGDYNKMRGTHIGDEVLRALGSKIRQVTRQTDDLCRWGGEEFAVAMPYSQIHEKESESIHPVERMRNLTNEVEINENGKTSMEQISLTFGATEYEPNDTFDSLFLKASNALKIAKLLGKSRTVLAKNNVLTDLSTGRVYILEVGEQNEEILNDIQERQKYKIDKSPTPQSKPVLVKLD